MTWEAYVVAGWLAGWAAAWAWTTWVIVTDRDGRISTEQRQQRWDLGVAPTRAVFVVAALIITSVWPLLLADRALHRRRT